MIISSRLDHVGIASYRWLFWGVLGWECLYTGDVCGIRCIFYQLPDGSCFEQIFPVGETKEAQALRRFMNQGGSKIHHIAFKVENIDTLDIPDDWFYGDAVDGAKPGMRVRFMKLEHTDGILTELVDYFGNKICEQKRL